MTRTDTREQLELARAMCAELEQCTMAEFAQMQAALLLLAEQGPLVKEYVLTHLRLAMFELVHLSD